MAETCVILPIIVAGATLVVNPLYASVQTYFGENYRKKMRREGSIVAICSLIDFLPSDTVTATGQE